MAWGRSIGIGNVADAATTGQATPPASVFKFSPFPFDASTIQPAVNDVFVPTHSNAYLQALADDAEKMLEDVRDEDREAIKRNLRNIMNNRLVSENARVNACRELSNILNNEEIAELNAEVKRLKAIIEANAPSESELPPHLRKRR